MEKRTRHQTDAQPYEDPLSNYDEAEHTDAVERALCEHTVGQLEIKPVVTLPPNASIRQAMQEVQRVDHACVLIVEDGKLKGIFTERDVLDKVADRFDELKDRPVSEVMTADPVAVYESDSPAAALCVIAVSGLRHVPVLDVNDHVVGVVSPKRVTAYLRKQLAS